MALRTITAANSVYMLSIVGLYSTPQQLQGYSVDAAFETEASEPAEVQMGVDGIMSAGFVPFLTKQTITLQADSASIPIFEDWLAAQKQAREILYANATIVLPSLQRKYALTQGVLSSIVSIPGAKKVMQPRPFTITWASIDPAPGV